MLILQSTGRVWRTPLGSPAYGDAESSYYQMVSDQRGIGNFDCVALSNGELAAGSDCTWPRVQKVKCSIIMESRAVSWPNQELSTIIMFFSNLSKPFRGRDTGRNNQC